MKCGPCSGGDNSIMWVIKQGALFLHSFRIVKSTGAAFDLTGYEVRCQFRRWHFESLTTAVAQATCTIIDAPKGKVELKLGATTTRIMFDRGVFDIEVASLTDPDEVYRVAQGRWSTSLEATLDGP